MADNFEDFDFSDEEPTTKTPSNAKTSVKENAKDSATPASLKSVGLKKRDTPEKPTTLAAPSQAHELLKKLKQKVNTDKPVKAQEATGLNFQEIGGPTEKIYKLTDLYLPLSAKSRAQHANFIESFSGLKDIREFEAKCLLPPPELNQAFESFARNARASSAEAS